jgi:hypothetical protein
LRSSRDMEKRVQGSGFRVQGSDGCRERPLWRSGVGRAKLLPRAN